MPQLTKIIQQNLKLYLSENNRQTKDGGGLRTSVELIGEDNLPFDPIGDISQSAGNFAMCLLYAGIDRDDAEPLLESGFIISRPPDNPNVSFLAFAAAYYGEKRKNAVNRVEAYSIKTIESRMTLLSQQTQNSRLVMSYQMPEEPDPKVGEVYCLDQNKTGYEITEEYIKIRKVETEIRRFKNASGYFERKVVKMEITNPLPTNFVGAEKVTEEYQRPPCQIKETMVADAGRYYGVKRLSENVIAGDNIVKVSSVFDQIIPSSEVPVALTDLDAGTPVTPLVASGEAIVMRGAFSYPRDDLTYYLNHPAMPSSIKLGSESQDNWSITDDGVGNLRDNNNIIIGGVNYTAGALTFNTALSAVYDVRFMPATTPKQIANTAAISVDQTNQTLNYNITLDPPPLAGSVSVRYRSGGTWYDLAEQDGTGILAGVDAAHGTGRVDKVTNTVIAEVGALPDVGSEVVFYYATPVSYFNRANIAIESPIFDVELEHNTITPSTISIKYLDDSDQQQTVTDDGVGNIIGSNFNATVKYSAGQIRFIYSALPKGGAQYEISYSYGNQLTYAASSPNRNSDGSITLDIEQINIKPHSLKMVWNVDIETFDYISTTPAEMQVHGAIDPYITVFDDGNGNLVDAEGKVYGTIVYATGIIKFVPETTVKIPVGRYDVEHIGYDVEQPRRAGGFSAGGNSGGSSVSLPAGNRVYRNTFSHWDYMDAGVSMPIGPDGKVDVWFNANDAVNNHTMTPTLDGLSIDLTPLYAEAIVGGSVAFEIGNKTYTDKNGSLYYEHDVTTGSSVEAGRLNYSAGKAVITAWTPGASSEVTLMSLLTSLDKNPVDEIVFRVPQAPIKPRSLQLRATTLQGDKINVTADADGNLTGANIVGRVEVADGVVRARFGKWVVAAGNEAEIWYNADALVGDKIFKPSPIFADSVKYNATAYTYLPMDGDVIGINTVRFPSDGRVRIFRESDLVVIGARYEQDLGTAFTDNQVLQLNVTGLSGCCVVDATRKHIDADLYKVDLVLGQITIISAAFTDYTLPLSANYCIEETQTINHVDISGALTLAGTLENDYEAAHTYVSSMMVGGKMQVYASEPFSQETWDDIWADERRGDEVLVKLDVKNYPIELTDKGTVTDDWLIMFRGGLEIDVYSRRMGHIMTTDWLQNLQPENPAGGKYFKIDKRAFGPTDYPRWPAGTCIRFKTFGALLQPWIIRSVQPSSYKQTDRDGATLCLRGNTSELLETA